MPPKDWVELQEMPFDASASPPYLAFNFGLGLFCLVFVAVYIRLLLRAYWQSEEQEPNDFFANTPTLPIPVTMPLIEKVPVSQAVQEPWDVRIRLGDTAMDAIEMADIVEEEFLEIQSSNMRMPWQPQNKEEWENRILAVMDSREQAREKRRIAWKEYLQHRKQAQFDITMFRQLQRDQRRLQALKAQRMRCFLIAEASPPPSGKDGERDWQVVGCAMISLAVPNAFLPPPFPTSYPSQFYISNLAVRKNARRRGVARALLHASEKLCARWGYPIVTLHVDKGNSAAEALYNKAQYQWVKCPQFFWGARRRLLVKKVTPVSCSKGRGSVSSDVPKGNVDGYKDNDGTFVWDLNSENGTPTEP